MTTKPSKTAYAEALAVVAEGDKAMILAAADVFAPLTAALETAMASIDAARTSYDSSGSMARSTLDGWYSQIESFKNTSTHLERAAADEKAKYDPPVVPSVPAQ